MGKKKALSLPGAAEALLSYEGGDIVEMDGLWGFVYEKVNKCWVWTALCRRARQAVPWSIGARDEERCQALYGLLPELHKGPTTYTDFYAAYKKVLGREGADFECAGFSSTTIPT